MTENWFYKYGRWLYQSFECHNSQDEYYRRLLNFIGVYADERAYKSLWIGLERKYKDG